MGYDRGDSFPFDFEPNEIPFGSENRKENCHHEIIPFNVKRNGNIVFSVCIYLVVSMADSIKYYVQFNYSVEFNLTTNGSVALKVLFFYGMWCVKSVLHFWNMLYFHLNIVLIW